MSDFRDYYDVSTFRPKHIEMLERINVLRARNSQSVRYSMTKRRAFQLKTTRSYVMAGSSNW